MMYFVSILILMDLPFLFYSSAYTSDTKKCFNPYSNGSSFFITLLTLSNGSVLWVSILILMDLPFLLYALNPDLVVSVGFNPYSNGSSFFIGGTKASNTMATAFQSLF